LREKPGQLSAREKRRLLVTGVDGRFEVRGEEDKKNSRGRASKSGSVSNAAGKSQYGSRTNGGKIIARQVA